MSDPAPAPSTPPTGPPSVPRKVGSLVDAVTVLLAVAFAFAAASFTARNSDLWLHLAAGRLIAASEYQFGHDPFADTTAGKYWANHAWLFDWAAYQTFTRIGPEGLVALKAFVIALAAAVMVAAGRGRGPLWVAVGCVLVAVLAMSPRLLLQPTAASLLLLALCLLCLRTGGRAYAAVPALIAVWVNLDGWFVLGPVLVLLFWVGRRIDPDRASRPRWPAWLAPASVAAGLASPHHVFAYQLPAELSPAVWASGFATDPRFAAAFASPWRLVATNFTGGFSPAAWGFVVLLALGLASFAVNRAARRSWRLAVWVPFAAIACWQVRLIPFFAVVGGPIAALNLREVMPPAGLLRFGRTLVASAAAGLIAFAWFGWLLSLNDHDRAAAWQVHADPTLVRTAEQLTALRSSGRLGRDDRVFVTHADLAHYLAWYAPGERYAVDSRLPLFTDVAGAFKRQSQALGILPSDGTEGPPPAAYTAVAYYEPDQARLTAGLGAIAARDSRWRILTISGMALLLAPKEGPASGAEPTPPGASDLPRTEAGPAVLAEPAEWWQAARERNRGRLGSWEADAATVYLRVFQSRGDDSAAWPQLAVQACRVGIERDARDPVAWQTLGRAYLALGNRTWHREAGAGFTLLDRVRNLQVVAALVQGGLLNPDSAADHEALAGIFQQSQRIDLALRHAEAALALARRAARVAADPAAAAGRAEQVARLADDLRRAVFEAENRYLVRTAGLAADPLAKAQVAAELGLTQKAIDVLLGSHADLYGVAGLSLLADLLLQTGQIGECRALLDRDEIRKNPQALGVYTLARKPNPDRSAWPYRLPAYEWFDFCQCAAAGRTAAALAALDRMARQFERLEGAILPAVTRGVQLLAAREVGLSAAPVPLLGRVGSVADRAQITQALAETTSLGTTRADLLTTAGVLQLESGDPAAAAASFRTAVALYAAARPFGVSRPGEALAARYNASTLGRP